MMVNPSSAHGAASQSGNSICLLVQLKTWHRSQSLHSTVDKQLGKHGVAYVRQKISSRLRSSFYLPKKFGAS